MESFSLLSNHRRVLANAMRLVMRRLDAFRHLLLDDAIYSQPGIDRIRRQRLFEAIEASREKIRSFCQAFGLSLEDRTDPLWTIQVGVSRLWEVLEDCYAKKLDGYGVVPLEIRSALDREIQNLIEAIEAIGRVAGEKDRFLPDERGGSENP